MLPQGFKNSPTILGNQLAKELETCKRRQETETVLQYVNNILIAAVTWEECLKSTTVVNPAVFLSSRQLKEEEPPHH